MKPMKPPPGFKLPEMSWVCSLRMLDEVAVYLDPVAVKQAGYPENYIRKMRPGIWRHGVVTYTEGAGGDLLFPAGRMIVEPTRSSCVSFWCSRKTGLCMINQFGLGDPDTTLETTVGCIAPIQQIHKLRHAIRKANNAKSARVPKSTSKLGRKTKCR